MPVRGTQNGQPEYRARRAATYARSDGYFAPLGLHPLATRAITIPTHPAHIRRAGNVTSQAEVAACKADASTVDSAINAYDTETGGNPIVTADLLTSGPTPYLKSFPSSPNYSISIVSRVEMVAKPSTATPVAYGTTAACSGAGPVSTTTTTVAPTTMTPASNQVTVTPTSLNYSYYGGQELLHFTNQSSITALSVTINVAQTPGVTYNSEFNSFAGGALNSGHSTSGGFITYTYSMNSGQSIPANYSNGEVGAQWSGTESVRVTSGDAWSVTSTSGGITSRLTGTF